ncbi:alpha/beta fold hydrolase [bacterium]|nr:alpha/beta fold hydrolase [bacterium]
MGCASSPPAAPLASAGAAAVSDVDEEEAEETVILESKFANNGGVKIHYMAGGEGPLVVMVHGFPDYWASWSDLMQELGDDFRVAAMDTRGYNLSDKPDGVEAYAMPNLVADIAAIIKAEGREKATVIGHDWGAAISWNFAFTYPELLENLVIMSVPHPATFARELATNETQRTNSQYARNFQKPGSENALTAEGLAGWVRDPAAKAGYIEAFKRSSFAGMMNYYRANYPDGTNAPPANAPPPTFPKINVPVLIIHGMKDTALLAAGHSGSWEYLGKDSTIMMLPDAGHFVQHDEAELVNETIDEWLELRTGDN